jgi:hypothetical protein
MDISHCSECNNNKIIKVSENGKEFIVNNKSQKLVTKIKIDNGLITKGKRCDWVLEIDLPCTLAFYIELKGKDIDQAYNQLLSTLDNVCLQKRHKESKKECYIVVSRVPKIGTNIQIYQAKLKKYHPQVSLKFKSMKAEITI